MSLARGLGLVVTVGGGASTLVGLVSDVLVPLASLTLYIALAADLALVACLWPARVIPWVHERVHGFGQRWLKGYWPGTVSVVLAVSTIMPLAAYFVTSSAPTGGWLATQVPEVRDLQQALGIISAQTAEIVDNTRAIKEDTGEIKKDLDEISQKIGGLKQETSADPRKELANLGVAWSTDAFVDALTSGDVRTAKLFLDGGMSPTVLHKNASAVVFLLQPGWPDSPLPMLKLLADEGFDFDEPLVDSYIMSGYSDLLPGTFENEDPPLQINGGTFRGPTLLWVVMTASFFGPTDHDLETMDFLLDQGVDTRLAKAYMRFSESWNSDNWPFGAIWKVLFQDSGETPAPLGSATRTRRTAPG